MPRRSYAPTPTIALISSAWKPSQQSARARRGQRRYRARTDTARPKVTKHSRHPLGAIATATQGVGSTDAPRRRAESSAVGDADGTPLHDLRAGAGVLTRHTL